MFWLSLIALLATAVFLGTDRLGRPLTDEEKKQLGALLREHHYPDARLIALRFAYKLARSRTRADDLMGRVDLRLVRSGWDPNRVSLVQCLCRLVWSEWTHAIGETEAARKAQEAFFHELKATEGISVESAEQQAVQHQAREEAQTYAKAQLEKLRAAFEGTGDKANLIWLKSALEAEGEALPTPQQMAEASGLDVSEFYAAAKRRKRAVRRLIAEERGINYEEEEP